MHSLDSFASFADDFVQELAGDGGGLRTALRSDRRQISRTLGVIELNLLPL